MEQITQILLTLLIGFISGAIGAIAGGGGLFSIPALMFLGLPPQMAVATNKLGAVGFATGALYKYAKEKKITWKYVLPLCILGILGGIIGSNMLLQINEKALTKIIGIILLCLLPTVFIKDMGITRKKPSKSRKRLGYFFYFLVVSLGAFFGGGMGTLSIYVLVTFFGLTLVGASATKIVPNFVMVLTALFVLARGGAVNYILGIALLLGMSIGGYTGAHIAVKKGNNFVKIMLAIIIVVSAVKILFF